MLPHQYEKEMCSKLVTHIVFMFVTNFKITMYIMIFVTNMKRTCFTHYEYVRNVFIVSDAYRFDVRDEFVTNMKTTCVTDVREMRELHVFY